MVPGKRKPRIALMKNELIYPELSCKIIGAAMEVHKELGPGFLEAVYDEAFTKELIERGIPFEYQKELQIHYKGEPLEKTYKPDFLIDQKVIVENKSLSSGLTRDSEAQMINYLKATKLKLGILINYGLPSLEYKRIAN